MNNKAPLLPEGGLLFKFLQLAYWMQTTCRLGTCSGGFGLLSGLVFFAFSPDTDDAEFMKQGNDGIA